MIPQLPTHMNIRSEDLLTSRRYGYVGESIKSIKDYSEPVPRTTQSEDLHKSRRNAYIEADPEERRRNTITSISECLQERKRHGYVEKDQTDEIYSRENKKDHLTNKDMQEIKEAASRQSVKYLFWKAKYYEHFHYVYKLVRDCKTRVDMLQKKNDLANPMPKDVIVKIGIVGDCTEDNIKLISKRQGKNESSEHIWDALPLVCFENESSSNSMLKKNALRQERACHKIFIRSDCDKTDDDKDEDENFIISVGQDKDQIEEIITSCLEEPLHRMLQKWSEDLKRDIFSENASDIFAEIEAIRKKLVFTNSKDTDVPIAGKKPIVPDNVKDYLFGRSDVNSFGLWNTSGFKVFVQKTTELKELENALIMLNTHFFQKYQLEIEVKRWREIPAMMQGDSIKSADGAAGTLGGFVTKTNDDQTLFALSCNHLFPDLNECAYIHDSEKEIGICLFTTRNKGCDFAAIRINDACLDSCDVAFRRDDKKKTNAKVYSNDLEIGNMVHKIGATTGVTNGIIISSEFYLKVIGECNRENIFLVKGTAGNFSKKGDSGSLVFSRPNRIQQKYVDVIGMVYANDLTLYDDDEVDIAHNNDAKVENKPSSSDCDTPDKENKYSSSVEQDTKRISFCCRIHTALELFKENQGDDFDVKFKNDLSSSQLLSSSSSESEDLNEENN